MGNVKRGRFTKATLNTNDNTVTLASICNLKEAMALYLDSDENSHLPQIERIDAYVYTMPLYASLTKNSTLAWAQYKFINKVKEDMQDELSEANYRRYNFDIALKFADKVKEVYPTLGEAITALVENSANYTQFLCFDFGKRNFSVDSEGNLILRDIFCDMEQLRDDTQVFSERLFRKLTS